MESCIGQDETQKLNRIVNLKAMTLIEQLIKAYEELTTLIDCKKPENEDDTGWGWYEEEKQRLQAQITALTKDYRKRREYAVVYKDFETFGTFDEAEQNRADIYHNSEESPDDFETVEIIRNKP